MDVALILIFYGAVVALAIKARGFSLALAALAFTALIVVGLVVRATLHEEAGSWIALSAMLATVACAIALPWAGGADLED